MRDRFTADGVRTRIERNEWTVSIDLAKPFFKKGDEKKRELFTAIQFTIDAIDQSIEDERSHTGQSAIAEVLANLSEDERRL